MNPWVFLFVWIGSQTVQFVFGVLAIRHRPSAGGNKRLGSLALSGVASIPPLITLMLFLCVFVIGGSSNVAQFAGESGMGLWRIWFDAWLPLFFCNPLALLAVVATAVMPPYPPSDWWSFASRICGIFAAAFAWYAVARFAPDA